MKKLVLKTLKRGSKTALMGYPNKDSEDDEKSYLVIANAIFRKWLWVKRKPRRSAKQGRVLVSAEFMNFGLPVACLYMDLSCLFSTSSLIRNTGK